jgi:hypothetical protein
MAYSKGICIARSAVGSSRTQSRRTFAEHQTGYVQAFSLPNTELLTQGIKTLAMLEGVFKHGNGTKHWPPRPVLVGSDSAQNTRYFIAVVG